MIARILLSVIVFGCSAAVGVTIAQMLCDRAPDLDDGPPRINIHPVIPVLVMAGLGVVLAIRGANTLQLATVAALGVPLTGSWYSDSRKGIVPDLFTLVPLAIIAVFVVAYHQWFIGISAVVTFAAFAVAAFLSRGRGMGWGDAKLAGLAGGILALPWSFGVLGVACLAATIASIVRDRGKSPVAFAPYISVSVLCAIALFTHG